MNLKYEDLHYTSDPRASTLPLSLDGDHNLSNHLTYQAFRGVVQDLKQDRLDYDDGGDLSMKPKKVKSKKTKLKKAKVKKTSVTKSRVAKPYQPSYQVTHINWNHWRTFYYVVKAGGFLKAEYYLRTSQSSISRAIQTIEKILGQQLLIRCIPKTDTVMSLMPAGAKILAEISQAIEIFESFDPFAR